MELKDEDIKKALECCISLSCEGCPLKDERGCLTISDEKALELINRQQAELDDLKRDAIPKLQYSLNRANKYGRATDRENARLKAEIEKLQKKYDKAMDNLKAVLKERAGEQNA